MEPIKSHSDLYILQAYDLLYGTLEAVVHETKSNIIENEASTALNRLSQKMKTMVQLALPHIHKWNVSERTLRTFKNNFIAGLASADTNFPIYILCRIVKQAGIILNILQTSWKNPRVLEYAQRFGEFDFNETPMALSSTKAIAQKKLMRYM